MKIYCLDEAVGSKLRFEKTQADHYIIYDGDTEIGYCYCDSYYSSPRNRLWTVVIDAFVPRESDKASSIAEAKKVAQELYATVLDREDRWNRSMEQ